MAVSQQRELQFTLAIVDDPKDPVKLVVVDPPTAATVEKGKLVIPMKDVNDMPDYFVLFDVEVVVSMLPGEKIPTWQQPDQYLVRLRGEGEFEVRRIIDRRPLMTCVKRGAKVDTNNNVLQSHEVSQRPADVAGRELEAQAPGPSKKIPKRTQMQRAPEPGWPDYQQGGMKAPWDKVKAQSKPSIYLKPKSIKK